MADRVVSVRLQAEIGQYISSMSRASAATMRLGETATASSATAQRGFDLAGKGALLLGGAVVAGLGMAISKAADFEQSMSRVQAATRASASELEDLRAAAMQAGADTAYSANEAAQAIGEMAKAGVSTADILDGGLNGALSLAAAGELDVAQAAEIASAAMTQFSLSGSDLPHVADLLAAGAGKSLGSVEDLGMALNQAGLVAASAGLSIEETTGTLAAFASAGLVGSDAGTSLRSALLHLQNATGPAAEVMEQYGISLYDAQGQFVGMEALAGQLQERMGHLTPAVRDAAMAQIFGSDAVRAANVLYKEGASGIAGWVTNVDDAGYAAEEAAIKQDNLAGDLEKLGGAFDTLMIQIGGGVQGPLRMLAQGLTGVLDIVGGAIEAFAGLPGPVQLAIGAFGAWSIAGDSVMSKLSPLKDSLGGVFGAMGEAMTEARAHGDGLTEVLGSVGEVGLDAAKGGLKELAKAVGPELGMAAATYLVSQFVGGILNIASAGDEAAGGIREMNDEIKGAETNDARFQSINVGLDELKQKATDAKKVLDSYDDQNMFDKNVWAGFGEAGEIRDARLSLEQYNEQIERLEKSNQRAEQTTDMLTGKLRISGGEVAQLADKYGIDLTGDLEKTQRRFEDMYTKEYGTTPMDAANATGAAMMSSKAQTEEAAKSLEDWLESLQKVADGFVDPLGAYTALLDEKTAAERESAEATAASTESTKDSWKDYVGSVDVSLDELATRLEEQIEAQDNWRMNVAEITQRGGLEVGQILAAMGEEGVNLAAQMANGTDAEFNRMADLLIQDARRGGAGAAAALDQEMKVMAAVGAAGAGATAHGIATALNIGVDEVARIASEYGIELARGVDPLLESLGKPGTLTRMVNVQNRARQTPGFWEGGYTGPGAKYQPAGIVHAGEYVLTQKQVNALGIDAIEAFANQGYANGGFVTAAAVPRPRSTAPYGMPISTAGDGAMQKGFDEVVAWLAANAEAVMGGSAGTGAVSGAWGSLWQLVKSQIPQARINSTFRAGDPGYHGRGKAIDFGFGSGPGGAGSAGLASINRLLHDQVGGNLAELIYDGIGDDRPDLKNGRPLTYNAATRAQHRNHVHAAVRDQGGYLAHGQLGINLSGSRELVLNPRETAAYEAGMRSREFSGSGAGGRSVTVSAPPVTVKFYVDGREFRGMARVEIDGRLEDLHRQGVYA